MYHFKNDYSEGVHPNILNKLLDTNLIQQSGYGEDHYTIEAKNILRQKINSPTAAIHFVSGGTQSNLLVISAILRPHEAVISADTGHIYTNEAGAIESTGHKVIPVKSLDGKLTPSDIQKVMLQYQNRPHVVKPKLVFISNSTELGTIYTKDELKSLSDYCRSQKIFLYLDGARLGHALTAENNDLTLADIFEFTDVFYIGATKNGAFLGEAIVFKNLDLENDFNYFVKQKGALLAKGRLISIQFLELFKDDLYYNLAKHANTLAMQIAKALKDLDYRFLTDSTTNQIFPILPKAIIEKLGEKYSFLIWQDFDEHTAVIRLITSWATDKQKVSEFIEDIKVLSDSSVKISPS